MKLLLLLFLILLISEAVTKNLLSPEEIKKYGKDLLEAHNYLRKAHGTPTLAIDDGLSKGAQAYAEEVAAKNFAGLPLKRSAEAKKGDMGESVAMGCADPEDFIMSPGWAAYKWYNEVCDSGYNFDLDGIQPGTAHFVHMIWKDTKSLGVGVAKVGKSETSDKYTCTVTVARYKPEGNKGKYKANVQKGSFTKETCTKISGGIPGYSPKKADGQSEMVNEDVNVRVRNQGFIGMEMNKLKDLGVQIKEAMHRIQNSTNSTNSTNSISNFQKQLSNIRGFTKLGQNVGKQTTKYSESGN